MDFLTSELLGVEETLHWKSQLTNSDSNWLDGRLTAGEHAALVKQNRQLEASSPLARSITEIVEQKIIASPLLKSFALIGKVHSILISRSEVGDGYGWHVDNPFSKFGRRDISSLFFLVICLTMKGDSSPFNFCKTQKRYVFLRGISFFIRALHYIVSSPS